MEVLFVLIFYDEGCVIVLVLVLMTAIRLTRERGR